MLKIYCNEFVIYFFEYFKIFSDDDLKLFELFSI